MKNQNIKLGSEKIKERNKRIRILKLAILIILLGLIVLYLVLQSVYGRGSFVVNLDREFSSNKGIVLYESIEDKDYRQNLYAQSLERMTNISINWLPQGLNDEKDGAHNGENYIAYTFYLENQGKDTVNYWYSISIDDVLRGVDDAVRVMVYQNGEPIVYAKQTASGNAEPGTEKFYSDKYVVMKHKTNFTSGAIDKYTVVIWLEGDDPQCVDAIIGGKMNMTMKFQSEIINENE